ncbi:unnamed protein product [Angiostrongylus costaricensis]|uniref:H15 domain-containing protein n=1 Tax=Angiostrongylus costaricensis TaxID=334426 RepID=A0A0R3PEI0_ANGCS|nr:unnamed protein product [Angiostrongylus costaricensis]
MSAAAAGSSPKIAKAFKPKAAKKAPSHPTYYSMILKALSEVKEKSGSSKAAILRLVLSHYKLGDNVTKLRIAPKKAVVKGELKQIKGNTVSRSFRLGEKSAPAHVSKKPAAKKHKSSKAATRKPETEKKAKSPKKTKVTKAKTAKKPVNKAAKPKTKKS